MGGYVSRIEESRSAFKILKGKKPLGKPRHSCEDRSRMDLKEIGVNTRNRIDLAEDMEYRRAVVNGTLSIT